MTNIIVIYPKKKFSHAFQTTKVCVQKWIAMHNIKHGYISAFCPKMEHYAQYYPCFYIIIYIGQAYLINFFFLDTTKHVI